MIHYFNFSSSSSIMSVAFPKKSNISRSSSSLYCRQRLIVDWDKELNNCFTFAFPAVSGTMITRRLSSGSFFLMTYPAFSSRSMSAVTEPVLRPVFSRARLRSSGLLHLRYQLISNRSETDREIERPPDETGSSLWPSSGITVWRFPPSRFWYFLLTTDRPPYKINLS